MTAYQRDTQDLIAYHAFRDDRVLWIGYQISSRAVELPVASLHLLDLAKDSPRRCATDPQHVKRITRLDDYPAATPPDLIVLSDALHFLDNIQMTLSHLRRLCGPRTRLLNLQINFAWAPLLRIAQRLRLRERLPDMNWLNLDDVRNLFGLAGFELFSTGGRYVFPLPIPLLAPVINRLVAPLPLVQRAGLRQLAWARCRVPSSPASARASVTIVVPARNEAGNIAPLLDRLPVFTTDMEVIFVEGHSKDHTWEEIQTQLQHHPRRHEFKLSAYQQTGQGKADAVRLGFSKARGDLLMILDADLSVCPEDLPLFYEPYTAGCADFLNGSRLVYAMEQQAMQVLNLFFNKLFARWVSWLIGQPVKDTLCGTKVIARRDYERIVEHLQPLVALDPFGDFQLLFGAGRLALRIADIPVRYKSRVYGSTNIRRFYNGWELLKFCLRAWPIMKR